MHALTGGLRSHRGRCLTRPGADFTNLLSSPSCRDPTRAPDACVPTATSTSFFLLHLRLSVRASYLSNVRLLLFRRLKVSASSTRLPEPECLELMPRGVAPRCARPDLIATHLVYSSSPIVLLQSLRAITTALQSSSRQKLLLDAIVRRSRRPSIQPP